MQSDDDIPAALRQRLRNTLGPLMDPQRPEPADRFLPSIPAVRLVGIDQRIRAWSGSVYDKWSSDTLGQVVSCPISDTERQSLLFVACTQRDGRARQNAVCRLGQFPGYLALAAALIRSADWVPEVQLAARDAVTALLGSCMHDDILAAWPIVLRLQARERAHDGWLVGDVEGWMLDPANDHLLPRARVHVDQAVRVWAYRHAIDRGETGLLAGALMQPDPRIGLHALHYAQARLDASATGTLARAGLDAPHPIVRQECLRALVSVDAAAAGRVLPGALLDQSAGVRRLAAYLTRQRGGDPRLAWRAALDGAVGRAALPALASIADAPEAVDGPRLHGLLFAPRPVVRQHALKGLLRLGLPVSPDEVARLLQLGGRVVAGLSAAVRASEVVVDAGLLRHVLEHPQANAVARVHLHRLLNGVPLWDCLDRLLKLRVREDDEAWWRAAIDRWIERGGGYAPLGGQTRKRVLLDAVSARADDLGAARRGRIDAVLERY